MLPAGKYNPARCHQLHLRAFPSVIQGWPPVSQHLLSYLGYAAPQAEHAANTGPLQGIICHLLGCERMQEQQQRTSTISKPDVSSRASPHCCSPEGQLRFFMQVMLSREEKKNKKQQRKNKRNKKPFPSKFPACCVRLCSSQHLAWVLQPA